MTILVAIPQIMNVKTAKCFSRCHALKVRTPEIFEQLKEDPMPFLSKRYSELLVSYCKVIVQKKKSAQKNWIFCNIWLLSSDYEINS